MPRLAIFLGAGASASEGAPLQNELFPAYFALSREAAENSSDASCEVRSELVSFFRKFFDIDVEYAGLREEHFLTFEEAIGLLDIALARQESLSGIDFESVVPDRPTLAKLRQYLAYAMAFVIARRLQSARGTHYELVRNLELARVLCDTVFISTNYDILIDNALLLHFPDNSGLHISYGIWLRQYRASDSWSRPDQRPIQLFKLHGSLNWLFCRVCNEILLTPGEKGVMKIFDTPPGPPCPDCRSPLNALIIPPSFYKNLVQPNLQDVWLRAERSLHSVSTIVFCGYSFPDADLHIKYLLKRAQTLRTVGNPLGFVKVNHYPGKDENQAKQEELRYKRFLGSSVRYTRCGFAEFAANPMRVLLENGAY